MATFNNAHSMAARQKARAERQSKMLRSGHKQLADECLQEALAITSGTTKTKQLRAMGHPYGRRGGSYTDIKSRKRVNARQRTIKGSRMRLPGLPINRQSGKLQKAIKLQKSVASGKSTQAYTLKVLGSVAPYAKYVLSLGGTVKMVARPFWSHLQTYWKRKNFELLLDIRRSQGKY